jgi:uncharacterized BrkB/YihY/UPF0761 family membrane protein
MGFEFHGTGALTSRLANVAHFMANTWFLIKGTAQNWVDHKDARQGAAIAYYSVFSLGPVLVIAVAIAGLSLAERPPVEESNRSSMGCSVTPPPRP